MTPTPAHAEPSPSELARQLTQLHVERDRYDYLLDVESVLYDMHNHVYERLMVRQELLAKLREERRRLYKEIRMLDEQMESTQKILAYQTQTGDEATPYQRGFNDYMTNFHQTNLENLKKARTYPAQLVLKMNREVKLLNEEVERLELEEGLTAQHLEIHREAMKKHRRLSSKSK